MVVKSRGLIEWVEAKAWQYTHYLHIHQIVNAWVNNLVKGNESYSLSFLLLPHLLRKPTERGNYLLTCEIWHKRKELGKEYGKKTDEKTTMTEESSVLCKYLLGISPSLPDSCCCHSHNDLHHPHCNLLILMSLPELAVCDTWTFTTSTLILTFSSSHSRSRTSPQAHHLLILYLM